MAPKPDVTPVVQSPEMGTALETRVDKLDQASADLYKMMNRMMESMNQTNQMARDNQTQLSHMMRVVFGGNGSREGTPTVEESPYLGKQGLTTASFTTPAEKSRTEGILPLPTLAIPFRSMESVPVVSKMESVAAKQENKGGSPTQRLDSPGRRVDLPIYDGQNPDDWVFRVEKCFVVNQTPEEEKMELALACMKGCAVTWLRIVQDREDLSTWKDFKEKLKKRFRPTRGGTVIGQMLRLKHTGTIEEYREQFEELSAEVPHVTNVVLEAMFLNGMRKTLQDQVVRYRPMGMDEIVDTAKLIEEQEMEKRSYSNQSFLRTNSAPTINSSNRPYNPSPKTGGELVPARRSFETPRENKGFGGNGDHKRSVINPCRHCGERYFSGHRCKSQQRFKCMEIEEEGSGELAERAGLTNEQNDKDEQEEGQELVQLSLCAMKGITDTRSMKMKGKVQESDVVVLIDSEATCNFISKEFVKRNGLKVTNTKRFGVCVGNGRLFMGKVSVKE